MNKRITPKERGLLKGAIRRVFSRSDLRNKVIEASIIPGYTDPKRPRVTKWCLCAECRKPSPKYKMACDHIDPVIPLDRSFEEMTMDEVLDRLWCAIYNLQSLCPSCHDDKSTQERKIRAKHKKERNSKCRT